MSRLVTSTLQWPNVTAATVMYARQNTPRPPIMQIEIICLGVASPQPHISVVIESQIFLSQHSIHFSKVRSNVSTSVVPCLVALLSGLCDDGADIRGNKKSIWAPFIRLNLIRLEVGLSIVWRRRYQTNRVLALRYVSTSCCNPAFL